MRSSMPPVEYQTDANFTDDLLDLEDNYSRRNSSEAEAEGIEFANIEAGSTSSSNHNIEEGIEVQRRDDGVSGSGGGDPSIDRQFDPSSSNASSSSLPSNHHHRSSRKGWGWVSKSILWSVIVLLSVVVVCLFVVISQQKVEINYLKYEHSSLKEKYLRVTSSPPPGRSKQAKNKNKNKKIKGSEEKSVKKGTPKEKKEECCACLPTSSVRFFLSNVPFTFSMYAKFKPQLIFLILPGSCGNSHQRVGFPLSEGNQYDVAVYDNGTFNGTCAYNDPEFTFEVDSFYGTGPVFQGPLPVRRELAPNPNNNSAWKGSKFWFGTGSSTLSQEGGDEDDLACYQWIARATD